MPTTDRLAKAVEACKVPCLDCAKALRDGRCCTQAFRDCRWLPPAVAELLAAAREAALEEAARECRLVVIANMKEHCSVEHPAVTAADACNQRILRLKEKPHAK